MTDSKPPSGSVGERIRGLLRERDLSQRQLAVAMAGDGASSNSVENVRRQISAWVNDQHVPSRENAEALAGQLDVPVDWLIAEAPRRNLAAALEELGQVVGLLTDQAEREAARGEEAARIVQSLDRRLEDIEASIGQLLVGQTTASGVLEEILRRWNEVPEGRQDPGQKDSSS